MCTKHCTNLIFVIRQRPFYSQDSLCVRYIQTQRLYHKKNITNYTHKQHVTGPNKCHIPRNETLGTLLFEEYYERYQIQNDGKYCQHERGYEMEHSMEKPDRKESLRKQRLKRHDHGKLELLKVFG